MTHTELAKKLLDEKKQKALEMSNKVLSKEFSCKAISIDEEKHTAIFVMSTETIDRHGDVIDQSSWILKYFNENPYFALQHRSDEFPLGRWLRVWIEEDTENIGKKRLVGEAYFAVDIDEDAARAWAHVKDGNMRMVSVGFIPHRVEYDEIRDAFVLYDCELMECSLVGIGSNRGALIKSDLSQIKTDLINTQNSLDATIKQSDNNNKVINILKARELIGKAIRQIK